MADTSQLISGVAERYASSLFELALEAGSIDAVGADLDRFQAMMDESEDLRRLIQSPVFSAEEQVRAISAVADKAGIRGMVANFLKVVASNRRLFALPGMIRGYRQIAAAHRGEVTAVTGKDVVVAVKVDASLLGGLIVKVGSRQIDTSLRTKLSTLKLALKEVG